MRDTRIAPSLVFALAFAVIALPFLTACSNSSGSMSRSGTGTVNVRLTDAPIDLSTDQSVNVTITGVTLYGSGDDSEMPAVNTGGAVPIATHPDTFDLLTLTGSCPGRARVPSAPPPPPLERRFRVFDIPLDSPPGWS